MTSPAPQLRSARGFTLLEVLVAVSILGLALTVILGSQVGLFSSSQRAGHLSVAVGLARCRMNETEIDLMRNGYPMTEVKDEGPCCGDEPDETYRCEWKVETVELPAPKPLSLDSLAGSADPAAGAGLGPLGALAQVQQQGAGALTQGGQSGGLAGLSSLLGASGGGAMGIAPMVMSLVYPDLKPMLQNSIRKLTVTVRWREGSNDRDLAVTQYVTNPVQGGFDPNASRDLGIMDQLQQQLPGGGRKP